MDKDQPPREAEMAFSETLRQKASAGRPLLEDLMGEGREEREAATSAEEAA
jgi:hypothetical protein